MINRRAGARRRHEERGGCKKNLQQGELEITVDPGLQGHLDLEVKVQPQLEGVAAAAAASTLLLLHLLLLLLLLHHHLLLLHLVVLLTATLLLAAAALHLLVVSATAAARGLAGSVVAVFLLGLFDL